MRFPANVSGAVCSTFFLATIAACSARGGGDSTTKARQADVTGLPLFFTQYGSGMTYRASEVDDGGNTYVVEHQGGTLDGTSYVHVFDPYGAHATSVALPTGPRRFDEVLRVNDTGVLVGGIYSPNDGQAITSEYVLDRLDANLAPLFHLVGPKDTYFRGGDVCQDGTTVAALEDPAFELVSYDTTGAVTWRAPLATNLVSKVRCFGSGNIVVAGFVFDTSTGSTHPYAQQLESDGTADWTFTSPDATSGTAPLSFDVDNDGNLYVGTDLVSGSHSSLVVYSIDPTSGAVRWSWHPDGFFDTFAGISAADTVAVTATRKTSTTSTGTSHYLTAQLDASGHVTFFREDPMGGTVPAVAAGVMLDGADDPFVCGTLGGVDDGATLYDASTGDTIFLYDMESTAAHAADVTNAVGRCIGQGSSGALTILAFQTN